MSTTTFFTRLALALAASAAAACTSAPSGDVASAGQTITQQDAPITIENWAHHPKLLDIRADITAIDDAFADKGAKIDRKESCASSRVALLQSGKIRLVEVIDDDVGSHESRYYYGANGALRFARVLDRSTFGVVESLVYFDATRRRLWSVSRMAGDDVDFDVTQAPWEESSDVQLDPDLHAPAKMFDRDAPCR